MRNCCAGVQTLARDVGIEDVSCADDHFRSVFHEVGDHCGGARDGHLDFDDGDAAARDGFGGKERIFRGRKSDGRDDADFFDASADLFTFHGATSSGNAAAGAQLAHRDSIGIAGRLKMRKKKSKSDDGG